MGMGLQAAYGAEALQQTLRQQMLDRLAAQQHAEGLKQQSFENDLKTKQFQSNEELKQAQLAALVESRNQAASDRGMATAGAAAERIPAGTEYPINAPIVGQLRQTGLISDKPVSVAAPPSSLAADPNAGDSALPGTIANAPSPIAGRLVVKGATSKQQDAQDADVAKVEAARLAAENRSSDIEQRGKDRIAQIQAAAAARPVVDKLTKVEHKDPTTGRTVIEWLPQSEVKGKTFEKGTAATVESRLASAQAVNQTGNDIIGKLQDPNYAKNLGVAMGRYSKLQDFIGNPPPEFSELAGQIESYALASMGVHGMRSAQGAQQINHMLSQPHTPESLIAAIKGLNGFSQHFMENEGRGGAVPSATASAAVAPTRKRYDINGNEIK